MSESDTFVAASSNSVYDAVVPKFATSELIIVRAHSLSLERGTLLKPYFKARREGKLATADPLSKDCKRSESTQAVSKQRIVEVQRHESISGAYSSDQNDDEEGHVTDHIAEGEAVDDRSPEKISPHQFSCSIRRIVYRTGLGLSCLLHLPTHLSIFTSFFLFWQASSTVSNLDDCHTQTWADRLRISLWSSELSIYCIAVEGHVLTTTNVKYAAI